MARPASTHPTDGELEILRILWAHDSLGLSAICETMRRDRKVATTTVATMLRVMREKGLVRRQGAGHGATWKANVSHQKTAKGMVHKLVETLFEGSADRLAMHLIEGGQLTEAQRLELGKLIRQPSSSSPTPKGSKR